MEIWQKWDKKQISEMSEKSAAEEYKRSEVFYEAKLVSVDSQDTKEKMERKM